MPYTYLSDKKFEIYNLKFEMNLKLSNISMFEKFGH